LDPLHPQILALLDEDPGDAEPTELVALRGAYKAIADARFAKPLDGALCERLARDHELVVTIEENALPGGFGSAVLEHLEDAFAESPAERARVLRIGLPDAYVTHGKPALLRAEVGLTGESVADRVLSSLPSAQPALT
jgi:1-deoxy-D-xylulose-5-phosphate synthase